MYLAMEYEGVAKSDDGGQTITPLSNGFVDRQIGGVTTLGQQIGRNREPKRGIDWYVYQPR